MHSTHVTGIVLLIRRGGGLDRSARYGAHPTSANTTRSAESGIHQFITSSVLPPDPARLPPEGQSSIAAAMFFTFPEDAHWNAERQAVEFGVEIGEYNGVVRVPRRVFQRLLPERPTPERCIEAYYLQRTRFESIAERKLRPTAVTEDGNVEISGRDLQERTSSRRGLVWR